MATGIRRVIGSAAAVSAVALAGAGIMSGAASAATAPVGGAPGGSAPAGYVRTGLWGPDSAGVNTDPRGTGGTRADTPAQDGRPGAAQPGAVSWKPSGAGRFSLQLWH